MKVSVIIPVYNSEQYLRRCLDSVANQSVRDYEIILIDDGSTDGSLDICNEYAERNRNIKVVHKLNGGVSSACNLGINYSRGKYLMFCDSDDYVEPGWIETMYQYAEQNPDLFVLSAFFKDDSDRSIAVRLDTSSPYKHFDSGEYYYMYTHGFSAYRWNRIYLRDKVAGGICFDENISVGEDVIFNLEYQKTCDGFLYVDKPLYHWVDNGNDSLSRAYHAKYYDDIKALYFPRVGAVAEKDLQEFCTGYLSRFYACIDVVNDERNTMTDKQKRTYIRYILHDEAFCHALKNSKNTRLKKLLVFKSYTLIRFYRKIHKMIRGR